MEVNAAGSAFQVQDASDVAAVRRAALRLAEHLGFSEPRGGQVALVVTELGTNLVKHARRGVMLLQSAEERPGEPAAIEILSLDKGPGIPDLAKSRTDGFSSSGTLGHGLGAIERQSDLLQIHTEASGTAVLARVGRTPPSRPGAATSRLTIGGVGVNAPGEQVCGDAWAAALDGPYATIMVADGLGHGLPAHDAARQAVAAFRGERRSPGELLTDIHGALRATRGAAVSVVSIDLDRGIVRCAGFGNVSATVLPPRGGARRGLVSHNGTAGHGTLRVHEAQYPYPAQSLLVMHSDGLQTHWDLAAYPGLRSRHPTLIAGVLYRDFTRQRDDVTVVVVKERTDTGAE